MKKFEKEASTVSSAGERVGDSCTMANSSQGQAIQVRCVEGSRYQVVSGYMLSKSGRKKEEEQRLKSTYT